MKQPRSSAWRALVALAAVVVLSGAPMAARAAELAAPVGAQSEAKSSLHTVEIPVEGMACFVCAGTIKDTVKSLAGVLRVEVSLEKRSALVTYFGDGHVPEQIVAAIDKLGYKAGTPKETP
jgi:copper chaperone CopZ